MKDRFEIVVTFRRPKFKDKTYNDDFSFVYNDKNYLECEGEIRDRLVTIANQYIDEAYY